MYIIIHVLCALYNMSQILPTSIYHLQRIQGQLLMGLDVLLTKMVEMHEAARNTHTILLT